MLERAPFACARCVVALRPPLLLELASAAADAGPDSPSAAALEAVAAHFERHNGAMDSTLQCPLKSGVFVRAVLL
eukprot:SAG25_NODE_167_length_13063_cov_9.799830_1_plen_75_part_00